MTTRPDRPASAFPTFRQIPKGLLAAPRWIGRWFRKAWRPIALVLAVLIAAHIVLNIVAGRRLEAELSRLRAEGAPLTLAQAAPPKVPDSENAAVLYQRAFAGLDNREDVEAARLFVSGRKAAWPIPGQGIARRRGAAPTMAQMEAILGRHQADFALLEQASRRRACRFPVNWDAGFEALFPELGRVRDAAHFLAAKALVDARRERADDALNDLAVAVRMSNHIAREPTLIAQLVRVGCFGITCRVLPEILAAAPPTAAESRALYALLGDTDLVGPWVHAMEGERCLGLWAYNDARRRGLWILTSGSEHPTIGARMVSLVPGVLWSPFLKLDEVYYLRRMQRTVALSREPYRQNRGALQTLGFENTPWSVHLGGFLSSPYSRATEARDKGIASLGLMQAALVLRQYQIAHGAYPASLADLRAGGGWAIPVDPFSGKPFIYRRQGAGYLIYSVGPDFKDNGGVDYETAVKLAHNAPGARGRTRLGRAWWDIAYDLPLRMPR